MSKILFLLSGAPFSVVVKRLNLNTEIIKQNYGMERNLIG